MPAINPQSLLLLFSGGPAPILLPPNLMAAIEAKGKSDPGLANLAGGFWLDLKPPVLSNVPNSAYYPYCIFSELHSKPYFTSADNYYEYIWYQFVLYADTPDGCNSAGLALRDIFDLAGKRLDMVFADGYLMALMRVGGNLMKTKGDGRNGAWSFKRTWIYRATVGRSLPS